MVTNNIVFSGTSLVGTVDSTSNSNLVDVIGNKEDAANITADEASVIGLLRYVVANLSTDADVAALIGALDTAAATGAVSDAKVLMAYIKQLVTQLLATDANVTLALADTNELQTDWANGGRLDLLIDAIKAVTDLLPDAGALTSIAQDLTVAKEATLGVPSSGSVSADIAVIALDTGAILTDTGTTIPALIGTPVADLATDIAAVQTVVDNVEDYLDGTSATPNALRREAGKVQMKTVNITDAANTGSVTLFTVNSKACLIKSIVLSSNGATTADLTSAAIEGGTGSAIEFISAATATQAALDAADKQVAFSGVKVLPVAGTVTVDLQGTGATAVDLQATIEYIAVEDGGYLA